MNPADKRLAVRTEDHPLEYADFEGTIPEGQYGAGTVMVWDLRHLRATRRRPSRPMSSLPAAKSTWCCVAHKLRGGFALVRSGKPSTGSRQQERWLLIKHRDEHANPSWNIESPRLAQSVLTGRTLKEIEQDRPRKPLRLAGLRR